LEKDIATILAYSKKAKFIFTPKLIAYKIVAIKELKIITLIAMYPKRNPKMAIFQS
jgi:hypothetical protein